MSQEISVELSKKLKMPYLFLQADLSPLREKKSYHDEVLDIMGKNPHFEHHVIEATHHLHLTHPELVAPLIIKFFSKHLTASKL